MTEHKEQSDKVFSMDAPLNKTLRWENKIRIHRSLLDSQFIDQIMCPKTPNIWLNTQIFPDEKGRFYGSGSDPDPTRSVSTLHRRLHPGFANRSRRSPRRHLVSTLLHCEGTVICINPPLLRTSWLWLQFFNLESWLLFRPFALQASLRFVSAVMFERLWFSL